MSTQETQDEPVMAGATDASEKDKQDGRAEQAEADARRDADLDDQRDTDLEDSVRSVKAIGEDRAGNADAPTEQNGQSHE